MIKLTIDGRQLDVDEQKTLLEVCLEHGIDIPNLCFLKEMENPPASCRLCFVQVEGESKPVSSCRVKPSEGMVVHTTSPEVRRLQRSALRILLSAHRVDCKNCPANKRCELQRVAKFLGVPLKSKHLESIEQERPQADDGHPLLRYDANRCVLCGRCIFVCRRQCGHPLITFARRGFDTVVDFLGDKDPARLPCSNCLACVEVCPVAALVLKDS